MDEQANFSGSRPGLEVIRGVLNINLFHVESYWVRDSTTESCAADSIRRIQWSPRSARKIAFPSTFSEKNLPLETFRNRGPCTLSRAAASSPEMTVCYGVKSSTKRKADRNRIGTAKRVVSASSARDFLGFQLCKSCDSCPTHVKIGPSCLS